MKLWAGRFQKETDTLVNDFNASITFDSRLYKQDITGSIAHATMLGEQGIIAKEDADAIVAGLKAILTDIEDGKVEFSLDNEDIHMNIETILTERIGAAGKRLHTGRSRNDQVAVDFRLFVKQEIPKIIDMLLDLEDVLVNKAERESGCGHARLHPPAAGTAHHLCPLHDGLCQHDPPGYHPASRTAWSAWTSARWAPARWPPPPTPSIVSVPPSCWASKSPPRTAWTPCLTATTPLSF